jgi:hypothetical protein
MAAPIPGVSIGWCGVKLGDGEGGWDDTRYEGVVSCRLKKSPPAVTSLWLVVECEEDRRGFWLTLAERARVSLAIT